MDAITALNNNLLHVNSINTPVVQMLREREDKATNTSSDLDNRTSAYVNGFAASVKESVATPEGRTGFLANVVESATIAELILAFENPAVDTAIGLCAVGYGGYSAISAALSIKGSDPQRCYELGKAGGSIFMSGVADAVGCGLTATKLDSIDVLDPIEAANEGSANIGMASKGNTMVKEDSFFDSADSVHEQAEKAYGRGVIASMDLIDWGMSNKPDGVAYTLRIKDPDAIADQISRSDVTDSYEELYDLASLKYVTDGSQDQTQQLVGNIVQSINDGKMYISTIGNVHAAGTDGYLTQDNIDIIRDAQIAKYGDDAAPRILNDERELSEGGFTRTIISGTFANSNYFKGNDYVPCEIQVLGKNVQKVSEGAGITSDIKAGKLDDINSPIATAYKSLNDNQAADYESYKGECYKIARLREMNPGVMYDEPQFPASISSEYPDFVNILSIPTQD